MRFSLFESWFLFLVEAAFLTIGAWWVISPDWAAENFFPGVATKLYQADPLAELNGKLLGITLIAVVALFYIATKHAYVKGDARTLFSLLGATAVGITVFLILYGWFHKNHAPETTRVAPWIFFILWAITGGLAAFFAWRWISGQAPSQPQPLNPNSKSIFTIVFLWVLPLVWILFGLWALIGPVSLLKWIAPAFVGTTAEPLYSTDFNVIVTRLWGLHVVAYDGIICPGLLRADQATIRKFLVLSTAIKVASIWIYGDFIRRYPATGFLSAPALVFIGLAVHIVLNLGVLYQMGPGAVVPERPFGSFGSPVPAAAPYSYA